MCEQRYQDEASCHLCNAGLGFGDAYESLFATDMAKEQLQAAAQQRKLQRRASLVGAAQVRLLQPNMCVALHWSSTQADLRTCFAALQQNASSCVCCKCESVGPALP